MASTRRTTGADVNAHATPAEESSSSTGRVQPEPAAAAGDEAYLVPVDPADLVQCESCQ